MKKVDYRKIPDLSDPKRIFDLTGRVGIIAGGGGKMGQNFAVVLARAGADVTLADSDEARCRKAAQEASVVSGRSVESFVCDAGDSSQVRDLFLRVEEKFERLDFFIHNVMGKPPGYYEPFDSYGVSTWEQVLSANLTGAFLCCREAARLMAETGGGSMVLTASIYGLVGPDQRIYEGSDAQANPYDTTAPLNLPGAYVASKGGLIAFARYLATLLAPQGIRVNTLVPGGVFDQQAPSFHEAYVERTPMGRMAVWSDFNGAILFLVSDASRYMTGSELVIDGGWRAW
ncbi:MAG: SDR family oxidoreductase [Deltaproteobacteria bacterium]|nr:SDR family oxidoreductase [Deltaproteobacteria bacterium]MBW2008860.1 SDR family oxidoreductase [Deltaproteobacteria bacterium]